VIQKKIRGGGGGLLDHHMPYQDPIKSGRRDDSKGSIIVETTIKTSSCQDTVKTSVEIKRDSIQHFMRQLKVEHRQPLMSKQRKSLQAPIQVKPK
jgi:hypothetical protein